jgi:hypothetical protein
MSFGDLPFTGGHIGITWKMCLKYTKNTTKYRPDMSPRGEGPFT